MFIGGAAVRWVAGARVVETATRRKMKRRPGGEEDMKDKNEKTDQEMRRM